MSSLGFRYAIAFLVILAASTIDAEEKSTKRSSKSTRKATTEEPASTITRRLPRHFASIVDSEQRQEIYEIQATFQAKIRELEEALAELEAEQMEEIEQVLTSTQRKQLTELRQESRNVSDSAATRDPGDSTSKTRNSKTSETKSTRRSGSSKRKKASDDS